MSSGLMLGVCIVATLCTIVFLVAYFRGEKKYGAMMNALGSDPLKEYYVVGSQLLEDVHYSYRSSYSRKLLKNCKILYGQKYGEFYFRVNMAQKVSMGLLCMILGLYFSAIIGEAIFIVLTLLMVLAILYYYETKITDEITRRKKEIIKEFPEVLSKLALLVNAGMIVREAWDKIATTGDSTLYQEMQVAIENMENGMSEIDAILAFSARCDVESITKFASTLVQNLTKGNKELVIFLKQYSKESWLERKQNARKEGEEASSKLLIPITLMFLGLLVMLCAPIFAGLTL